MGQEKRVWRLAFFGRMEERKGIKLFVDAVSALNVSGLPNFEVHLIQFELPQAHIGAGKWTGSTSAALLDVFVMA